MRITLIRCWYARTDIPFCPFNPPFCSVGYNDLDAEAGKALAKALETNKSLESLEYDATFFQFEFPTYSIAYHPDTLPVCAH